MPSVITIPPFPDDVPTVPLVVVDYSLILQRDSAEIERLWDAARSLGFWYLKNHGVDMEADAVFEMGAATMQLPFEEKMRFEQGDDGNSFGYKAAGANATNAAGDLDTPEFINIAHDDVYAWPKVVRRTYPSTVNERMESTMIPFVRKSTAVTHTILAALNDKLGLPEGALAQLHRTDEFSASETRCIKSPVGAPGAKVSLGAHTDFGSLTFLHNRLGGLQVLPPGSDTWKYVKPLPGHAICNLGDAVAIFSGGIVRSNIHRVMPPPGAQGQMERWSMAFFLRPANHVVLNALTDQSPLIADSVRKAQLLPGGRSFFTGETAQDWFMRRIKNQRIKNRTGPETWMSSRGTERVQTE
ncbi:Clavaminate synthase-like protein [Fistulina hepatica ATCC 64428]|uniref:Clavaminate synthase-like protein n=1 Tax=Fistulina hepatica ATCC 64428 TaxID=1128425 RepID=A0A0D7A5P3_9AGAR|nr:Clavaminate synthase-like protein [Fistulina hepatica ATCC 64428]